MHRHHFSGTAVLGSLLALAACAEPNTIEGAATTDANKLVAAVSAGQPSAQPGDDKASIFAVPREARVLLLARP